MKRTGKKLVGVLLTLAMMLSLLPAPVSAAVTDTNDWAIFDADDQYNLPETQEVVLQRMLQNNTNFVAPWGTIVKEIIKQQRGSDRLSVGPYIHYQELTNDSPLIMKSSLSAAYNEAAGKLISAINTLDGYYPDDLKPTKDFLNNQGNRIAQIETEGPAFARYQMKKLTSTSPEFGNFYGGAGAITIQLFYDFKVEGLPGKFSTPDFEVGDTEAELSSKGITFALGGSSDSYTVKAENTNDFPNTVQKSYTYEKSTSTSTEVSNSYSKEWSEETTVGVDIGIPVVSLAGLSVKVEQKVGYSYGLSKTYSSAQSDTYSQSISDTIEVPLPPHTGIDIDVSIVDSTTSIPYTGAARVTYKTMVVYAAGIVESDEGAGSVKNENGSFSFGDGAYSAILDLDRRIVNAMGPDSDRDRLDLRSTDNGLMANSAFKPAADKLRSGQPYSPYGGLFNYTSKGTTIIPKKVVPLYPAARFVPDTESITLYEQQSQRLDGINVSALNEWDVPYYGFNARLDGEWTVVDEDGDLNMEYAEIGADRNRNPIVRALKPAGDTELYLRYAPNSAKVAMSDDCFIEEILLTIRPVPLSTVTLTGSFDEFYLNDGSNTTNISGLTVTAEDLEGEPFTPSDIKWYAEAADGITVDEDTGEIDFDKAGTYQIYAIVNEVESNRVSLTVLPPRYLAEITVEDTIPALIWNDDSKNSFDLSDLTVSGQDQYGDSFILDPDEYHWTLGKEGYASIAGNILTGLVVGTDTLTLSYPTEARDAEGAPLGVIYAPPLAVTIKALPYINELYYDSGAPMAREGAAYDLNQIPLRARDQHGDPIELPDDITWSLAENNQTDASIDAEKDQLTVPEGTVPEASVADVILEAYSPTADRTASNVVVKVRQKPVLKQLTAAMTRDLLLRVDENAMLNHYFTVAGYDQYGEGFLPEPVWHSSNPAAIQLNGGILHALVEDAESLIYADCENSRGETITSNKIPLKVGAPRRLSSISVNNVPQSVALNAVLSLNTLAVATFDQYGQKFTAEELEAYPSSIRWTLENYGTTAAINENTLSFGSQSGKVTLICACVNSDTGTSFVEKRLDIRVGPYVSAISPASANMPSAGGTNVITLTGVSLENGLRISAFDGTGSAVPGITAVTTGTGTQQKATLSFPANNDTADAQTYTLKLSYNDGTVYEAAPAAIVTVAKKGSGGGGSGGGGGGGLSPSGTLIDSKGGTARKDDAKAVIPKGAVGTTIRVTITKIDSSGLTFPKGYRLVSSIFDFSKDKSGNFNKDVTITLPFDKSKADQEKDELAVFGWDGSNWNMLDNIEVDWSAGTVSGTTDHFAKFAVLAKAKTGIEPVVPKEPEVPFAALNDILGHWAEDAIRSLVGSGAINGYSDGTFKPDKTVTRAEFAQMLVNAMEIPAANNSEVFADTESHWGKASIAAAYAAGIIYGYGDNKFGPDDPVTREQIVAMVIRTAKLTGPSGQLSFADNEAISDWAKEPVAIAVANGLITGYSDQTFRPGNNATRAEAAVIISLALEAGK
jgi:hypothetical protein